MEILSVPCPRICHLNQADSGTLLLRHLHLRARNVVYQEPYTLLPPITVREMLF